MLTYKAIPQVEFDKAVQKMLGLGISRTPAENIVISFWKITQQLDVDFKKFIDLATASGKLDVSQEVLDCINITLPETIRYRLDTGNTIAPVIKREL